MNEHALRLRLDELAYDVGRLRRRFRSNPNWTGDYIAARIAGHVASLVLMVEPSAGEIASCWAPGDDEAADEAIRVVDERSDPLVWRLRGRRPAPWFDPRRVA